MNRPHSSSPDHAARLTGLRKLSRHIHDHRQLREIPPREATDLSIVATPDELVAIRNQLGTIEQMLAELFAPAYDRGPESMLARAQAAAIIELNFDAIVEEWCVSIEKAIMGHIERPGMANALVRFVAHLRDPSDLRTYVHLRRHCQSGMLARAKPSEFNIFHIVLKQVILKYLRANFLKGRRAEIARDTIVAAIDERRLMVAQFYIESREHALKASEEKYRNSIEAAPDPMYEIDPATLVVMGANTAAIALHEAIPDEREKPLIGINLIDLCPDEMRSGVEQHIVQVIARGSDQVLDLPISGRFFDVHSAVISAGKRRFIQMILRDVTQRHEMLDTLVKAERLAAAGTFASGVAHEVNNPLASISSLVQALLPDEADPGRQTTLRTILSQITRIATTLKDLVNFGRPASPQRRPLDLNGVIGETLRLVAYNRRFDGIRLESALASDLAPAFADQNGIQQVILNLLFNAGDAVEIGHGVITIKTTNCCAPSGDSRVMMTLTDNGCGIAPENLERVFDPFFTTKASGSGVGLGLSLCQSIVLSNQGTIKIESAAATGTKVTICLPAAPTAPDDRDGRGTTQ
jgi:signal transduction histidine kinase